MIVAKWKVEGLIKADPQKIMDEINEIGGLIDENSVIVPKGIETLRKLVNVQ